MKDPLICRIAQQRHIHCTATGISLLNLTSNATINAIAIAQKLLGLQIDLLLP